MSGWARVQGEVMLYSTEAAMLQRNQRLCISGLPVRATLERIKKMDGQMVVIRGRILRYRDLPLEDAPVLQRRLLNEHVISNFCLKEEVLSIEQIRLAT
jgi:hypothetical protein